MTILIGEDRSETVELVHARDCFLSRLSWEELQALRTSVRRTLAGGLKDGVVSDRQVDAMIEAIGPKAAETRLKNIVDARRRDDFHRREYFV